MQKGEMLENFGVTVAWQGSTIEGLSAIASEADKLGFGYFWVPEAWGLEAFSTISHILSRTSSIRVGSWHRKHIFSLRCPNWDGLRYI